MRAELKPLVDLLRGSLAFHLVGQELFMELKSGVENAGGHEHSLYSSQKVSSFKKSGELVATLGHVLHFLGNSKRALNICGESITPPLPDIELMHDDHGGSRDMREQSINVEALPGGTWMGFLALIVKLIIP